MTKEISRRSVGGGPWHTGVADEDGGNGGSQPGALQSADFLFTEGPLIGTYSATLEIEAGTLIANILVLPLAAPWGADAVGLTIGDTGASDGYFSSMDLQSLAAQPYDPTGAPGNNWESWPNGDGNGSYSVSLALDQATGVGRYYDTADTLSIAVATSQDNVSPINAVDQGTKTFVVDGDESGVYTMGTTVIVYGSAGNDGFYTVASSTFGGASTEVEVDEAIPSSVADGHMALAPTPAGVLLVRVLYMAPITPTDATFV